MNKAIILSRVSTTLQDYEQQTNEVVQVCINDGYDKENIITIEDMESGVKLDEEHRLGLNKLKEIIESEDIDTVYAYEISRIGRRPEVNYAIRNFLQQHRVQLIILKPYIKLFKEDFSIDETANMTFSIFNALAENEGYLRKARLARGKAFKKAQGRWVAGAIPFGYKTNKEKKIVIDEHDSAVVMRIFNMYLNEGMSTHAIAKELLATGHLTNSSKDTAMVKVCRTLNNRIYTGLEDNRFPQLISEETYNAVQKKLSLKRTHTLEKQRDNSDFWCKGLVTNGYLNYTVHSANDRYQTKKGQNIRRAVLHEAVSKEMREYYIRTKPDVNELIKEVMNKIQLLTRKIHNTYKEETSLKEKKNKIWERNIEGRITDDKAQMLSDKVDRDLISLERSRRIYEEDKNKLSIDMYYNEDGSTIDMSVDFDKMADKEKFEAVHKVFDKIIVESTENRRKKNIIFIYKQ